MDPEKSSLQAEVAEAWRLKRFPRDGRNAALLVQEQTGEAVMVQRRRSRGRRSQQRELIFEFADPPFQIFSGSAIIGGMALSVDDFQLQSQSRELRFQIEDFDETTPKEDIATVPGPAQDGAFSTPATISLTRCQPSFRAARSRSSTPSLLSVADGLAA
jgi:hypothetical protein